MYEPKTNSANFVKKIQMHFEYHLICMNITLIYITLLIGWYSYASGSFSHCKTVYLTHIYEPKTKSAKFVERIQVYFEYNSLCTNAGLININLMTSWQNEQNQKILIELQHCVVKTNVTGSDHFKQKVISINSFYLTFQNKQILNWLRRVRYLFSYNLQYLKLILSGKSSIFFHKTLLLSL